MPTHEHGIHMEAGSADRDGSAASESESRKRSHCARPEQLSRTVVLRRAQAINLWLFTWAIENRVNFLLFRFIDVLSPSDVEVFLFTPLRSHWVTVLLHLDVQPPTEKKSSKEFSRTKGNIFNLQREP